MELKTACNPSSHKIALDYPSFYMRGFLLECCGVVVPRCSGHDTGVVSSNPPCVTIRTQLVWKATENPVIKSASLEKAHSPVSGFC